MNYALYVELIEVFVSLRKLVLNIRQNCLGLVQELPLNGSAKYLLFEFEIVLFVACWLVATLTFMEITSFSCD